MRYLLALGFLLLAAPAWAAQITLTWQHDGINTDNYDVQRKVEDCALTTGTFTDLASVPVPTKSYTDLAVAEGLTYCYRVRARNIDAASAWSNSAGKRIPFSPPAAPSGVTVQ